MRSFKARSTGKSRRTGQPEFECLEHRSLLSTLGGFPAHGFRADHLGDAGPWDVATEIDGLPARAVAFAEGSEARGDAPSVSLVAGEPRWVAGVVGDTLLRGVTAADNDVDFYRIDLPGQNHFALELEVVAWRFGSELDATLTLFDSSGNLITSNDNAAHAGYFFDPELFRGLDSGTYFVAVSASGNAPDPNGGSGSARPDSESNRGPYLLRVAAVPDSTRPHVTATNIEDGATLDEPPTWITVRFSEAMDLAGLESGATLTNSTGDRLSLTHVGYDSLTREMTYLVRDRAEAGAYRFTLHAAQVVDRANNTLDGGPNGDATISFHVAETPVARVDAESNESADSAQPLGVLFERELSRGVRVVGAAPALEDAGAARDEDYYRIELLRPSIFRFQVQTDAAPAGSSLSLLDGSGQVISQGVVFPRVGATLRRFLAPGEYFVHISVPRGAESVNYQLTISAGAVPDVPLTNDDPGPVVQVVLRSNSAVAPVASGQSSPMRQPIVLEVGGEIVGAVSALPAVASAPLGRPRAEPAGDGELAWLDQSRGGSGLPAGFSSQPQPRSSMPASVARVSGSFLDSLPDQLEAGNRPLGASADAIADLFDLLRGRFDAASDVRDDSHDARASALADESLLAARGNEPAEDFDLLSVSPKTATLGMAVALGVASAITVPQGRRGSSALQRAIELIGLDS